MQWWPSCSPRRSAVSRDVQQARLRYKGKGGMGGWPLEQGVNLLDYKQQPLWQITLILAAGLDDPHPAREAV